MSSWAGHKGSGSHRGAGVDTGGNSVHAVLTRVVVMDAVQLTSGCDFGLMQTLCVEAVGAQVKRERLHLVARSC